MRVHGSVLTTPPTVGVDYDDIVMTQSPRTMDIMCFIYAVL